jgi:ribosome-associated toxin RatA of RatAB toxin-antitoxin module
MVRLPSVAAWSVALACVVTPLTSSFAGEPAAPDAEVQRLAALQKAERYDVAMGSSVRAGGAAVLCQAPLAIVERLATDYGHYVNTIPRFQKSRVVGKKGNETDVYLQVPILHGAATVWSLTRFGPPQRQGQSVLVSGRMIEGNVDDFRGQWRLRGVGDNQSVVKMELLVVPKFPAPSKVITAELQGAAANAANSLCRRAEALAKEAASLQASNGSAPTSAAP